MKWKLSSYDDGNNILGAYGFSAFQHLDSFAIISRFIATGIAVIFFLLLPEPIILHKGQEVEEDKNRASASRDSMGSFDVTTPLPNLRPSEIVRPLLFMRESSVTGRPSNLSINHSTSHSLMGGKSQNHGPTVMFQDVTFRFVTHLCVLPSLEC